MSTLYIAVSGDEYELPIAVADTARELAKKLGVDMNVVYRAIHRQNCGLVKGSKKAIKYYKIELEDEEGINGN